MILREATPADAATLARLHAKAFPPGWTVSDFTGYAADPAARLVVASMPPDVIAGFVLAQVAVPDAEILTIAVSAEHRAQGIGRALVSELERLVLQVGVERVLLDVRESNAAARAFYRSAGYGEDGRRKNYYPGDNGAREDAILMSRSL